MSTTARVAPASAGLLTALSLAAAGRANGNQFVPAPAPTSDGFDASDAALGAMAGLVAAGAGVIAVSSVRRRQGHLAHPV